jgi:hypothetical protein
VLRALNKRVMGRADAQATCLALRIESDGAVTLANAGHMPPYLNGELVAMEGALPLGMIESAEFSEMRFQLKNGDRLVLMSDGIAEATDVNGQLFGFDRVHDLLSTASTAAGIATAAQAFGPKTTSASSLSCEPESRNPPQGNGVAWQLYWLCLDNRNSECSSTKPGSHSGSPSSRNVGKTMAIHLCDLHSPIE